MKEAVLVTGASTGIGWTCAEYFLDRDFKVFAGVRKGEDATKAEERGLVPVMLDVTNPTQVRSALESIEAALGGQGLQALVNNAGVAVGGPVEGISVDEFRRQFDVNFFGLLDVTKAALPLLRRYAERHASRKGPTARIINMSSMAGKIPQPFMAPYCASKHALEALTDCMRYELRPWRIHTAAIEPGAIRTPIWEKGKDAMDGLDAHLSPDMQSRYSAGIKRIARLIAHAESHAEDPVEVARAVYHAVTAIRPKTRYPVGSDARVNTRLRKFAPDRFFDWVIMRVTGLGRQPTQLLSEST